MYNHKLVYILFLINNIYTKTIIIFVHPSTLWNIPSEFFFPAIQNLQISGLHKINECTLSKRSYNQVFLPFLNNYNLLFKKHTMFYIFSWGGTIYPIKHKEKESYNLYLALINLKKQFPNDKIILIACSHGGSVVLGMGKFLKFNNISIELIILLGTPINKKNNEYARYKNQNKEYCFNKIINIYTENDYIQKIDIFFNNYHFCSSTLDNRKNLINYKIKNYGHINLWHKIFKYDPFIIKLPKLLYKLNNNK